MLQGDPQGAVNPVEQDPEFEPEGLEEEGQGGSTDDIIEEIMRLADLGKQNPDTDPTEMDILENITSQISKIRKGRFSDQQNAMSAGAGNRVLQRAFGVNG